MYKKNIQAPKSIAILILRFLLELASNENSLMDDLYYLRRGD